MSGVSDEPNDGADVDDTGIGAFHERALESFNEVEGSFEIGVENGIPIFGLHAHNKAIAGDSGVVDKNVDSAEVFDDGFANLLNRIIVCDIERIKAGRVGVGGVDFLGGGSTAGGVPRDDGKLGSFAGKGVGNGETNASTGTGDDDTFS